MKKTGVLIKKEILEILRDKKTLIIMVLVPMLLYPAIILAMSAGMTAIMQAQVEKTHTIWYDREDESYIAPLKSIYEEKKEELDFQIQFECAKDNETENKSGVWLHFSEEMGQVHIRAEYNSANQESVYTEAAIYELAELYRRRLLAGKLEDKGLSEDFLYPVSYEAADGSTASETMGMSIGGAIGMLLITMILMGAFYPAVDVTTGEKERGTLETLLTLPVTNFQLIMSKYIAVSLFACMTAIISLISLGGVVVFLMSSIPKEAMGEIVQIPIGVYLGYIPVLLIVMAAAAMLITALCMCFCVFAKSTKEANNYITPVMLVVMFASMVGMIPTVELDYRLVLIPLVNVSLLIKQVLAQQMDLMLAGFTILVNAGYGIIVIGILAKMYDREDILFSDGFRSFRIFQKRSDIRTGTIPASGDVFMCLAVLLLAIVYAGSITTWAGVFAGAVVTQLLVLITPLLAVWYMKSDARELFSLKIPGLRTVLGSVLLYAGVFAIILIISAILAKIFEESAQNAEMAFGGLMEQPFILLVLVLAVMPAIGEELLFRGFVFGSFCARYRLKWAVCMSAFIFGLFHLSLVKLIPTALLGACFAIVTARGKSIFVPMLLHFVNNLVSVTAMKYPQEFERAVPILAKSDFSAMDICLLAAFGVLFLAAGYLCNSSA